MRQNTVGWVASGAIVSAAAIVMTMAGCGSTQVVREESPTRAGATTTATTATAVPIAMTELRERAMALLIKEATAGPPEQRVNAIEGLTTAPGRLVTILPPALADENAAVRAVAAMVIGRARLNEHAPHVVPLLNDPSPMVRASGLFALRRCGFDIDPSPLGVLLRDENTRVRAHTAFILGELGNRSAVPMLRDASLDSMPRASQADVKLMALQMAEARVKLGDDTAVHEIRAALYPSRPEDLEAVALAAQIIGQVNDRAATDQLIFLTARWDETKRRMPGEVRLAAAASLARLGLPRGAFIANEHAGDKAPALRAQAAYVYGETGLAENLSPLTQMLDDPDGRVRIAAATAIVKITDRTAAGATAGGR